MRTAHQQHRSHTAHIHKHAHTARLHKHTQSAYTRAHTHTHTHMHARKNTQGSMVAIARARGCGTAAVVSLALAMCWTTTGAVTVAPTAHQTRAPIIRTQFHGAGEHVFGVPLTKARLSWATPLAASAAKNVTQVGRAAHGSHVSWPLSQFFFECRFDVPLSNRSGLPGCTSHTVRCFAKSDFTLTCPLPLPLLLLLLLLFLCCCCCF